MGIMVYKNVAYAKQAAFGTSIAVGSVYLPIKSFEMNKDPGAEIVDQTTNTAKGLRRAVNVKDEVKGSAAFNVDFDNIGYWLNLAWGGGVTTATSGTSATNYTFVQNTTGSLVSGRFELDKGVAIEAFQDVFANEFSLTASDGIVEGTISLMGSHQIAGSTFTPSVTETRIVTFANATWLYGDSIGVANATKTLPVTSWTLTYKNGSDSAYESGSNVISRQNMTFPSMELSFTRFFDGSSTYLVMRDNVFTEDTERAMVLNIASDSDSVIVGTTPFLLKFPFPKVKLQSSERPYSNGDMVVETVKGQALADDTAGYMCEPQLITTTGFTF